MQNISVQTYSWGANQSACIKHQSSLPSVQSSRSLLRFLEAPVHFLLLSLSHIELIETDFSLISLRRAAQSDALPALGKKKKCSSFVSAEGGHKIDNRLCRN